MNEAQPFGPGRVGLQQASVQSHEKRVRGDALVPQRRLQRALLAAVLRDRAEFEDTAYPGRQPRQALQHDAGQFVRDRGVQVRAGRLRPRMQQVAEEVGVAGGSPVQPLHQAWLRTVAQCLLRERLGGREVQRAEQDPPRVQRLEDHGRGPSQLGVVGQLERARGDHQEDRDTAQLLHEQPQQGQRRRVRTVHVLHDQDRRLPDGPQKCLAHRVVQREPVVLGQRGRHRSRTRLVVRRIADVRAHLGKKVGEAVPDPVG